MLSAMVGASAIFVPLDSAVQPTAQTTRPDATVTSHALAEPVTPGGPFVAAWSEGGLAQIAQLDPAGAVTGGILQQPGAREVAVRRGDARQVLGWRTADDTGCGLWALDDRFTPVIADPLIYSVTATCQHSAIGRHDAHVNLLVWIDGSMAEAHGQRGTDDEVVGAQLELGSGADALELATTPAGFFLAVGAGEAIQTSFVIPTLPVSGDGLVMLGRIPQRVAGTPVRMVGHGSDALVLSIGASGDRPQVRLTRLCAPSL
jgi:hypothetical protein